MPKPVFRLEPPHVPYFLKDAVDHIEALIDENSEVFEYGSGASTLWFAERVKRIVTVEHDDEWHAEVQRALEESGLEADANLVPEKEMPGVIDNYGQFDLVLVDCWDFQRVPAVYRAMKHVKPGGYLVLDDSHWHLLAPARKRLKSWPCTVLRGKFRRHNGEVRGHETSIYQRPPVEEVA